MGDRHHVSVHKRRTAKNWAEEIEYLVDVMYHFAEKKSRAARFQGFTYYPEGGLSMNISDFVEKYYLHDSGLREIIVDKEKNSVHLIVDLCNWMQDSYVEGEPEILPIEIVFLGVSEMENLGRDIDEECGDEFIVADVSDNGVFHAELCTTENQEIYEIRIRANDVQVNER